MTTLTLADGREIATDKEGFLQATQSWNHEVAEALAQSENIQLTAAHWEVIELLRTFHQTYDLSPAMRPLVRYVKQNLGADKGSSVYLLTLFPGSPAKIAAKIAGLPRPENCL